MKVTNNMNTELTNSCKCINWDDQGYTLADYCRGYCWDDMQDEAIYLLNEWQRLNNNPEAVLICGTAMTWDRLSGYEIASGTAGDDLSLEIIKKLKINGEYILRLNLEANTLKITRSSHDEPTGATFTLEAK